MQTTDERATAPAHATHTFLLSFLPEHHLRELRPLQLVCREERRPCLAGQADLAELGEDDADVQIEQREGHDHGKAQEPGDTCAHVVHSQRTGDVVEMYRRCTNEVQVEQRERHDHAKALRSVRGRTRGSHLITALLQPASQPASQKISQSTN